MSRKARPALIGAFVVGAVIIAVTAVLVLTSGRLFQKQLSVVMHFQGSVKGLDVGAPVSFRGVQVGTVKDIRIVLSSNQDIRIPVTAEIDLSAFTVLGYPGHVGMDEIREHIRDSCRNEGLRAQLQMQSLLTGQLFIQIDFFPGSEARFVEAGEIPEIPTVPTTLEELSGILEDLPVRDVVNNLNRAAESLAGLAGDRRIPEAIQSVDKAFSDISELADKLDSRTRPLGSTLVEMQQALAQGTATLAAAERAFAQAAETLAPIRHLVADDSELLEVIDETLAAMTEAAHAVAALAETLERRPESLLKGKGMLGGE